MPEVTNLGPSIVIEYESLSFLNQSTKRNLYVTIFFVVNEKPGWFLNCNIWHTYWNTKGLIFARLSLLNVIPTAFLFCFLLDLSTWHCMLNFAFRVYRETRFRETISICIFGDGRLIIRFTETTAPPSLTNNITSLESVTLAGLQDEGIKRSHLKGAPFNALRHLLRPNWVPIKAHRLRYWVWRLLL